MWLQVQGGVGTQHQRQQTLLHMERAGGTLCHCLEAHRQPVTGVLSLTAQVSFVYMSLQSPMVLYCS
jgi:hypothetical protein